MPSLFKALICSMPFYEQLKYAPFSPLSSDNPLIEFHL